MKILHTVIDWWLSEAAIKMFKSLPVENEFVFLAYEGWAEKINFKVLKSVDDVKIIEIGSPAYHDLLRPGRFDLLWIHGLYESGALLAHDLPDDVKVMWTSWGFDYLRFDVQWLYAPRTLLHWLKTTPMRVILKCLIQWSLNKVGLLKLAYRIFRKRNLFFNFFKRVDYFSTVVPTEEPLIRRVLGNRAVRLNFHCTAPSSVKIEYPVVDLNSKKMLIGHQADITCNHYDILAKIPKSRWEIWAPLSYSISGLKETENARSVIEYGKRRFGERFHPIVTFMPFPEYLTFISSCSVFVFNNYRQQAVGNVTMALQCGGCVFMSPLNPVYQYYIAHGIIIYPISRMKEGLDNIVKEFMPFQMKNIMIVTELRNHEKLLHEIRDTVRYLERETGKGTPEAES